MKAARLAVLQRLAADEGFNRDERDLGTDIQLQFPEPAYDRPLLGVDDAYARGDGCDEDGAARLAAAPPRVGGHGGKLVLPRREGYGVQRQLVGGLAGCVRCPPVRYV